MQQVIIKVLPVEKAGHTLGRGHVRRTNYSSSNLSSLQGRGHKEAVLTRKYIFPYGDACLSVCLDHYTAGDFRQVYGVLFIAPSSQIIQVKLVD